MYHEILVALTGKEADEAVLAHVKTLAAGMGASVTLLQVITIADDDGGGLGKQFQLETGSSGWRREKRAERILPLLADPLRGEGLPVETAVVVSTLPEADELARYASQHDFDLIAMAKDTRPWYRRWIGGSPAEGVLRRATVPILLVDSGARKAPAERPAPEADRVMALLGSATL
jgi:nucleotide-binding universal stress UspA family protein